MRNALGKQGVAHDRFHRRALVNTVMNVRVPCKVENFLTATVSFSRRNEV